MGNKKQFIEELKKVANILAPHTKDDRRINNASIFVPTAMMWHAVLLNIASLLEFQRFPISKKQTEYLEQALFGNMGSLTDFSFGSKDLNANPDTLNASLRSQVSSLYLAFKKMI